MYVEAFLTVLVALQLSLAQQCEVVIAPEDKLREDVKQEINIAVQGALENITSMTQLLLDQIHHRLDEHLHLGRSPAHPATSCKGIADNDLNSTSGYYWIQAGEGPLNLR